MTVKRLHDDGYEFRFLLEKPPIKPVMSSFTAKKLDYRPLPGDNLKYENQQAKYRISQRNHRQNRPQANRGQWRPGMASGGF